MYFYYGIDLRSVVGCSPDAAPPFLLLELIRGLPDDSWYHSEARGDGTQGIGWGTDRHMRADLIDAMQTNTVARGNLKKKVELEPYPRPGAERMRKESMMGKLAAKGMSKLDAIADAFSGGRAR